VTIIVTAVFPIYFAQVAAAGLDPSVATARYGIATTVGLLLIALLSPLLGAMADRAPLKKRMLGAFIAIGASAVGLMVLVGEGDWLLASVLFLLANIGANGSYVFYDALLPHVAPEGEMDQVSTAGYALGYLGGGLLLGAALLVIQKPEWVGLGTLDPTWLPRISFGAVAVWWIAFSIPLLKTVPEPAVAESNRVEGTGELLRTALADMRHTVRDLFRYRQAFLMLVAFLIYNDGIGTIIRMSTVYGTELGIDRGALIGSILLVQFIGIPCAFLFGAMAKKIGAKPSVLLGLGVYMLISVIGYRMDSARDFLILAVLVGLVQGGTQALSRSLFASMIPRERAGEFFGIFAVFEKFAGILGPAVFTMMVMATGSSRGAILSVIAFFVVGGAILWRVDVESGQSAAGNA
jgi:UMF1 family MFS transporter